MFLWDTFKEKIENLFIMSLPLRPTIENTNNWLIEILKKDEQEKKNKKNNSKKIDLNKK